jgi:hypothetical protein
MNAKHTGLSAVSVLLLLGLTADALAAAGPQYRSLRALSMGNAFVALVDDKEALYYNPAGLNLINALGNASARPSMSNYPRNRFQARLNPVGMAVPLTETLDMYKFFDKHQESFGDDDALREDSTFFDDLAKFHRRPIEVGTFTGAEFAMHNFGAALWMDARFAPYVALGPLLPQAGIDIIQLDMVVQVAGARGFLNSRLAAGAGYRLANRQLVREFHVDASEAQDGGEQLQERAIDTLLQKLGGLTDPGSYGHGLDLGVLWQQTPWLRVGGALQNFGMYLNHQFVTPELTVGVVVTPPLLSSGGYFARKVNLALDLEDILNNERNYRPYSKINFGAEVEQQVWWGLSVRVGGGFKGGYPSAGAGVSLLSAVHFEAATWAEEGGYYTGHIEDRYYAVRVGLGL